MIGRPSDFTDEIATRICDLLMDGLSMRSICQADDMPHRTTVVRWLERYPEFASMYAHARTLQADLMDDMILETATRTRQPPSKFHASTGSEQGRTAELRGAANFPTSGSSSRSHAFARRR